MKRKKSGSSYRHRKTLHPLKAAASLLFLLLCIFGYNALGKAEPYIQRTPTAELTAAPSESGLLPETETEIRREALPRYSGEDVIAVNGNIPYFTQSDITDECFLSFSELDALGRCGEACACLGQELFPTEERGSIGNIKPSGWHTVRYDDIIADKYLYNRCHLIAFMLCGENANELNLITGTRYLNVTGMIPYENSVHDYIEQTGNHVLYRVTPVFDGGDLVAYGVLMEAYSVEDDGEGVRFNVFAYNIQPGIEIDYATGESRAIAEQ